jgi:hypothetical protein
VWEHEVCSNDQPISRRSYDRKALKLAKTFIALFFSLALLAGQFSFATPAPQAKHRKACCGKACCKHGSCCSKPANSNSVPLPIVPTRTASQTDWQLAAAITQQFVVAIRTSAAPIESSHAFIPSSSAVPLYQRHCSFLI